MRGESVELSCIFELGSDRLYSVKWYKNNVEFYRYIPRDWPPGQFLPHRGVRVDVSIELFVYCMSTAFTQIAFVASFYFMPSRMCVFIITFPGDQHAQNALIWPIISSSQLSLCGHPIACRFWYRVIFYALFGCFYNLDINWPPSMSSRQLMPWFTASTSVFLIYKYVKCQSLLNCPNQLISIIDIYKSLEWIKLLLWRKCFYALIKMSFDLVIKRQYSAF